MRLIVTVATAVVLFVVGVIFTRRLATPARGTARATFALVVYAGINAVNLCSPGWCTHYGLPFRLYGWSDAIIIFNGENLNPGGFSIWAVLGNGLVALAIFAAVKKLHRSPVSNAT